MNHLLFNNVFCLFVFLPAIVTVHLSLTWVVLMTLRHNIHQSMVCVLRLCKKIMLFWENTHRQGKKKGWPSTVAISPIIFEILPVLFLCLTLSYIFYYELIKWFNLTCKHHSFHFQSMFIGSYPYKVISLTTYCSNPSACVFNAPNHYCASF